MLPAPSITLDRLEDSVVRNIKLVIQYDGTNYHGWQVQPGLRTIQGELGVALSRVCNQTIQVYGSGRTDAGAHARGQVAHFKTAVSISCSQFKEALNALLPDDIRILSCEEVPPDFHARYSVKSKCYVYTIQNQSVCSVFLRRFVYHVRYKLDGRAMQQAAPIFLGEHDFTSFADAQEDSPSKVRTVFCSEIFFEPSESLILYRVEANGFLHRMVRAMVGALIEVGRGKLTPQRLQDILAARDRRQAPWAAPAQGLCLKSVQY